MKILDAGCGRGGWANKISTEIDEYVGIDIMPNFIKDAKRNALSNQNFSIGCLDKLPFKDSSFDRIYCYEVLEHVVDEKKAVSELARILKCSGKIYITVPHPKFERLSRFFDSTYMYKIGHLRIFEPEELKTLLERNNIKINSIKYTGFFSGIYLIYRAYKGIQWEEQSGNAINEADLRRRDFLYLVIELIVILISEPKDKIISKLRKHHIYGWLYYALVPIREILNLCEKMGQYFLPRGIVIEGVKR